MRGLAVVALGAILIWLGLSQRDNGGGEAEPGSADGSSTTLSTTDATEDEERLVFNERAPSETRGSASSGYGGSSDGGSGYENSAARSSGSSDAADFVPDDAPFALSELEVASADVPPALPVAQSQPVVQEPGFDGRSLDFSDGPGGNPIRLAAFLLEAWIAEDPADLETYLTQGEGAELPGVQRQLVASFWQAVASRPENAQKQYDELRGAEGVTTAQVSLLAAALDVPGSRAVPSSAPTGRVEPIAYAMRMVLLEDEARNLMKQRDYSRSAVSWSDLIQQEIDAPWSPHRQALIAWGAELERAQMNHRFNVNGSWPSVEEKVQGGINDSLVKVRKRVIARRQGLNICTGLIAEVNGITGYIQPGQILRIPTDPVNLIVDLESRVLLYRHGDEVVRLWDVGIGKPGHRTPEGEFTIGHKIEKPAHTTLNLPYGDPRNPLGSRWAGLRRLEQTTDTSYGIHGTGAPEGVGSEVSLGCIRMRNEDVNELFEILPQGSRVVIQD